jgi:hypothetical protein
MFFRDPSIPTIRLQWNPKAKKMADENFPTLGGDCCDNDKDFFK